MCAAAALMCLEFRILRGRLIKAEPQNNWANAGSWNSLNLNCP